MFCYRGPMRRARSFAASGQDNQRVFPILVKVKVPIVPESIIVQGDFLLIDSMDSTVIDEWMKPVSGPIATELWLKADQAQAAH